MENINKTCLELKQGMDQQIGVHWCPKCKHPWIVEIEL